MKAFVVCFFLSCCQVHAQWSNDPAVNTPVFTGPNTQFAPIGVSDASGGAFVFWFHQQTGSTGMFAQRLDAFGNRVLPAVGVQIYQQATVGAVYKDAIPDGLGGAIVAWSVVSVGDTSVRAQRLDGNGSKLWFPVGGVVVSDVAGFQRRPRLTSNGSGGAFIVWEDTRSGGTSKIHIQNLNSIGQPQWTLDGIPVCGSTPNSQFNPMITSDGSGGAVVTWEDFRTSPYMRLYAQRMNSAGQRQWPDSGALVSYAPTSKFLRGIVADATGGAIVCWRDIGMHGSYVITQRVNGQGNVVWDITNGVPVSTSGKDVNPLVVSDGNGGALFAWEDSTLGSRQVDIYAQRVGSSGTPLWTPAVSISTAPFEQYYFSMIANGVDGAIVAWTDARNWPTPTGLDIYAQSVDGTGNTLWALNGATVSQPPSQAAQLNTTLVTDGAGGAIALWDDNRNAGNGTDIYAQGLASLGLPLRLTNSITQTNTNYPFSIGGNTLLTTNFGTLGTVSTMTVSAFLNAVPQGLSKALPRYLDLTANGSGFNATLVFNYTDGEVAAARLVNRDANLKLYRHSGSSWVLQGGTVDTIANTVTLTNVTGFSRWAIRDPLDTIVSAVGAGGELPPTLQLHQNYPNPFNPSTTIRYELPKSSKIRLSVFDILGREVLVLVNEEKSAGVYAVHWNASGLASRVYFYRIQAGDFVASKKLLLLK